MSSEDQADLTVLDVAIVGGGVSGIYTGWRLLVDEPTPDTTLAKWRSDRGGQLKVAVFEGSGRIGGRLLSATPPGLPHTTVEIGGMRYVSTQTLVRSLVENELELPRHEQFVNAPENVAYLRRKQLRCSDLTSPDKLPYSLTGAEASWVARGNDPSGLLGSAVEQLLPGVTTLTGAALQSYLEAATIDGAPLYQHGFWNLIARALSSEGYQLARTTVGYDSLGANANAVDMTREYFDFTPDVKYYLLDDGYEVVPWTLQDRFETAGGHVHLGRWLAAFDACELPDGTTGVRLEFSDGKLVLARSIVLALPRRAIEMLRPRGPVLDPTRAPEVQQLLDAVEPVPLYKLFLTYPFPWWETVGVSHGRSLTDMPLRQCYYWAVEARQPGGKPSDTSAALMLYNDESSVSFWGGLRHMQLGAEDSSAVAPRSLGARRRAAPHGGKPFQRKPTLQGEAAPLRSGGEWSRRKLDNWKDHVAPHEMVMEMHRQLVEMHGVRYAPEPLDAAFMDWSDAPYGGGVHFWNPGHRSWELLERMTQPVADFPCYVCGEAWSTNQTWVEGALQTAEIVLQKRFGLAPPKWVTG